jgi:hypothetical protein
LLESLFSEERELSLFEHLKITIKQTNVIVARRLSMAWDFIGQFKYLFCMLRSALSVKLILSLSDPQLTPATVQIQYCNSLNSMTFGFS